MPSCLCLCYFLSLNILSSLFLSKALVKWPIFHEVTSCFQLRVPLFFVLLGQGVHIVSYHVFTPVQLAVYTVSYQLHREPHTEGTSCSSILNTIWSSLVVLNKRFHKSVKCMSGEDTMWLELVVQCCAALGPAPPPHPPPVPCSLEKTSTCIRHQLHIPGAFPRSQFILHKNIMSKRSLSPSCRWRNWVSGSLKSCPRSSVQWLLEPNTALGMECFPVPSCLGASQPPSFPGSVRLQCSGRMSSLQLNPGCSYYFIGML